MSRNLSNETKIKPLALVVLKLLYQSRYFSVISSIQKILQSLWCVFGQTYHNIPFSHVLVKIESWSPHTVELALWTHYVASELKPELLDCIPPKTTQPSTENGATETVHQNGVVTSSALNTPTSQVSCFILKFREFSVDLLRISLGLVLQGRFTGFSSSSRCRNEISRLFRVKQRG